MRDCDDGAALVFGQTSTTVRFREYAEEVPRRSTRPVAAYGNAPACRTALEGGLRMHGLFKQPIHRVDEIGGLESWRRASGSMVPLVTVVTVSLNAAATIGNAIRSVLGQSHDNVEYLVIDGGSTDGTLDVIRSFENHIDYWVSERDGGIYEAMNKAVDISRGDWILFLGADDELLDSLHLLLNDLPGTGVLCYGDVLMKHSKRLYNGHFGAFDLAVRNICQQAILYPREVFARRRFESRYRLFADYAFNMTLYASKAVRFEYRRVTVAIYNDAGASTAHSTDPAFLADRHSLVRQHFCVPIYLAYRVSHALTRLRRRIFPPAIGYAPSIEV